MPRFAANLTLLFTELPMEARFEAAAAAGFEAVEILFPYDLGAEALRRPALAQGLDIVLMNCPPPNWTGGPRGFAAQPTTRDRFRRDFDRCLRMAEALRARQIHVMAGTQEGTGAGAEQAARDCLTENLAWACERAPHASLLIEPINQTDMPGYALSDFDLAAQVIGDVGAPNLGLQFDAYHAQIITGDAMATFAAHRPLIRHIQIAGLPGRHEPVMGGGLDYPAFFDAVDASGFRGWVSAEYHPATLTEKGLGWLQAATSPPKLN